MSSIKKFTVTKNSSNTRLDNFLSKKLKISRSQAKKMIDDGLVLLNDKKPKKAGDVLKEKDKISFVSSRAKRSEAEGTLKVGVKRFLRSPATQGRGSVGMTKKITAARIVSATPDYVVVDKPSGLLTHPTEAKEKNSLIGWLIKKYPEIKKASGSLSPTAADKLRPGVVHRLDREASGLLVVARTPKMFDSLKEQFKNRTVEKEYIVLVHGRVDKDWSEINFPIARSENSEKMAALPQTVKGQPSDAGREAATEFSVEKRFINFTLLRVKIHTGRTHQIRVHLFAYNHPVVGDPIYFQKKQKRNWDEKCGRLFLHSAKLGFTDLDGERRVFASPLPKKLENFLTLIK